VGFEEGAVLLLAVRVVSSRQVAARLLHRRQFHSEPISLGRVAFARQEAALRRDLLLARLDCSFRSKKSS